MSPAGISSVGPSGLVTVIVGEVGRSGASRSRSAKSAPATNPPSQWSWQWSSDGPGPLLSGCDGEPDLTLTISTEDARRIKDGELEPSVAFMQGKLKSTGDNALLLGVLAWTATPDYAKAVASWSEAQP